MSSIFKDPERMLFPASSPGSFFLIDDYTSLLESKIVDLVEKRSGIVFDQIKRKELKPILIICMEDIGEDSFSRYYQRLAAGSMESIEWKKLINFITINETFFFRVQEHFDILEKVVVPELVRTRQGGDLRIWSAGSSSGEEAYSIVITLLEIPEVRRLFNLKVLGTDISDEMLYLAKKGIYSGRTLAKVPQFILKHYFEPCHVDRFQVSEEVRTHVQFAHLNLAEPFKLNFFGRPDIIFFRNVLIYFNRETTTRIIDSFYNLLNDNGYLFLGPSETLWDISDKFQLMMFDRAYIYRKKSAAEIATKDRSSVGVSDKANVSTPLKRPVPQGPGFENSNVAPVVEPQSFQPIHPTPVSQVAPEPEANLFATIADWMRILLEQAALMVELGDYQKANSLLHEVLIAEPNNKTALLLKMTSLANRNLTSDLLVLVAQIQEQFPIFPEVHFLLGRYYESQRDYKEAVNQYRKILFIHQDYVLAREKILRILKQQGEEDKAELEARNILEQLNQGKVREFQFSVGETINRDRLEKFCHQVLNS